MSLSSVQRARMAGGMAAACGTFLEHHELGMQIIGERNHEEQEYESTDERCPLAPRCVLSFPGLTGPTGPPHTQTCHRDYNPQYIEK